MTQQAQTQQAQTQQAHRAQPGRGPADSRAVADLGRDRYAATSEPAGALDRGQALDAVSALAGTGPVRASASARRAPARAAAPARGVELRGRARQEERSSRAPFAVTPRPTPRCHGEPGSPTSAGEAEARQPVGNTARDELERDRLAHRRRHSEAVIRSRDTAHDVPGTFPRKRLRASERVPLALHHQRRHTGADQLVETRLLRPARRVQGKRQRQAPDGTHLAPYGRRPVPRPSAHPRRAAPGCRAPRARRARHGPGSAAGPLPCARPPATAVRRVRRSHPGRVGPSPAPPGRAPRCRRRLRGRGPG